MSVFVFCRVRCENNYVTIQSSVSKSAQKKDSEKPLKDPMKPGFQHNRKHDIDKFHLYFDFTCNIQKIEPHQVPQLNSFCF